MNKFKVKFGIGCFIVFWVFCVLIGIAFWIGVIGLIWKYLLS